MPFSECTYQAVWHLEEDGTEIDPPAYAYYRYYQCRRCGTKYAADLFEVRDWVLGPWVRDCQEERCPELKFEPEKDTGRRGTEIPAPFHLRRLA